MSALFDAIADLSLSIESIDRTQRERDTSSGFVRTTTTFHLSGPESADAGTSGSVHTGRGEDVTYDTEDHDALADAPAFDFTGEYTFTEFSSRLDEVDLFRTKSPERETARHYRRWAVESAALDLALRQNDLSLSAVVARDADPVRFVASMRLGDPPTTDRLDAVLDAYPDTEFKLDPTPDWDADVVEAVAATEAVRILDLKGLYEGTDVDADPDPDLYERLLSAFPDAVIEDPGLTDETRPLFDGEEGRISWDYPITGVASVENLSLPAAVGSEGDHPRGDVLRDGQPEVFERFEVQPVLVGPEKRLDPVARNVALDGDVRSIRGRCLDALDVPTVRLRRRADDVEVDVAPALAHAVDHPNGVEHPFVGGDPSHGDDALLPIVPVSSPVDRIDRRMEYRGFDPVHVPDDVGRPRRVREQRDGIGADRRRFRAGETTPETIRRSRRPVRESTRVELRVVHVLNRRNRESELVCRAHREVERRRVALEDSVD